MVYLLCTPFFGYGLTLLSVAMFGDWWDSGDNSALVEYVIICEIYFAVMSLYLIKKKIMKLNEKK